MGSLVRTLLIWLLVLAVPSQGAAAASMAFCGPDHHGAALVAEVGVSAAQHAHHGDAMSVHEVDSGASDGASVADDESTISTANEGAQQKCSACASCCSAGAILGAPQGIPAAKPAPTVFTTVVPAVNLFAADGPERPPRTLLV